MTQRFSKIGYIAYVIAGSVLVDVRMLKLKTQVAKDLYGFKD